MTFDEIFQLTALAHTQTHSSPLLPQDGEEVPLSYSASKAFFVSEKERENLSVLSDRGECLPLGQWIKPGKRAVPLDTAVRSDQTLSSHVPRAQVLHRSVPNGCCTCGTDLLKTHGLNGSNRQRSSPLTNILLQELTFH